MKDTFEGNCLALLIGSLPVEDHGEAVDMVFGSTPEIPCWVQLPRHPAERMIAQFLPGMPGLREAPTQGRIQIQGPSYADETLSFYEDFLAVTEGGQPLDGSRFALGQEEAGGFFALMKRLEVLAEKPVAVKGQVTGPVTFCLGVTDGDGRPIFYNDQARDMAVKLLALKAAWQVRRLSEFGRPVIVFLDEPALAGYGSSAMIGFGRESIIECLQEVIGAVRSRGGLAGIHVCANTDWAMILETSVDIVNFDAYGYFDRFMLFPEHIRSFLERGGMVAWGIVPTSATRDLETETPASLVGRFRRQAAAMVSAGVPSADLLRQSLITPSCGTGSLSVENTRRVLDLTRGVSRLLRKEQPAWP